MRSPPGPVGRPSRRTRETDLLGAAAVVLTVLYAAFPAARDALWIVIGAWSAAAIFLGVRRFRPTHPVAWYLLAGATLAFAAAPVGLLSGDSSVFSLPAGTDWISIAGYPLAAAGLLIMVRHRLVRKDVAGLLDALIAVSAVTFVIWAFVISPYVHLAGTPPGYRRSTMVYPVGDLLLLGIFARLIVVPAARTRSLALLAAGMVAMTFSDVCETLWLLHTVHWFDDGHALLLLDAGWIAFWLFWGFAALTPSMRESTRPVAVSESSGAPIRLWVLAGAAVLTPIAGAAEVVRDDDAAAWLWPLLAAGVFLLILARLSLVLADHRRALDRERILLDASETLVAAAGADQVAAALASGATRLLGRRTPHEVVVGVKAGPEVLVTVAGAGASRRHGWRRWEGWRWGSRGRRGWPGWGGRERGAAGAGGLRGGAAGAGVAYGTDEVFGVGSGAAGTGTGSASGGVTGVGAGAAGDSSAGAGGGAVGVGAGAAGVGAGSGGVGDRAAGAFGTARTNRTGGSEAAGFGTTGGSEGSGLGTAGIDPGSGAGAGPGSGRGGFRKGWRGGSRSGGGRTGGPLSQLAAERTGPRSASTGRANRFGTEAALPTTPPPLPGSPEASRGASANQRTSTPVSGPATSASAPGRNGLRGRLGVGGRSGPESAIATGVPGGPVHPGTPSTAIAPTSPGMPSTPTGPDAPDAPSRADTSRPGTSGAPARPGQSGSPPGRPAEAREHKPNRSPNHAPNHPPDQADRGPDPALEAGDPAWRAALEALGAGFPAADPEHGVTHLPDVHHSADLPAPLAGQLQPFDHALVFPLGVDDWSGGVLAVGADEEDLIALGTPVELLSRQAALTLHRISLGQEIARRDSEAYFRALVQNTSDAILIVDPARRVRYASPSALAMFEHEDLLGRDLADLIGPVYAADVAAWGAEPATRESIRRDWELPMPSGLVHEVEATVADLRSEPTVNGFVLSLHDVTTARGLERTLQRHAYHDPLTGLPNRLAFSRGLDDALELASPEVTVSVIMLDLDHFREVNDFHGREAGDDVLRATTRLLRAALQPGDVLARVGGDEFAVLQVRSVADTPKLPLGMPGEQGAYFVGAVPITTSGALSTGTPKSTGGSLLADVEMTLHAAKAAGVNSWRRYDPELRADLALAAARRSGLDQALRDESFELVYQPLVWLDDGDVGGFESLVRWPQPDGGVIMPDEFIPLAEATGQILPLGRWILRTATAQAAEWNRLRAAKGAPPVKVSVNVSAHELRDPLFPTLVYEALKNADLDPSYLILEATETALIHHAGTALANLRILARAGIGVALDDFGTGYSSLSYLRDLPVSSLKIDKLFVDGVPEIRRQTALVRGIIGIAKSLDLLVIAEGIENPVQSDMLLAMGADIGQGYLFSPPMSTEAASALMSAGVVDLLEHGAGPQGAGMGLGLGTGMVTGLGTGQQQPAARPSIEQDPEQGPGLGLGPGQEPGLGPGEGGREGEGSTAEANPQAAPPPDSGLASAGHELPSDDEAAGPAGNADPDDPAARLTHRVPPTEPQSEPQSEPRSEPRTAPPADPRPEPRPGPDTAGDPPDDSGRDGPREPGRA